MVQWVVGSILHGGPIELFLVPASAPLTKAMYVLSCWWDDSYKRTLAPNQKEKHTWQQRVFSLAI